MRDGVPDSRVESGGVPPYIAAVFEQRIGFRIPGVLLVCRHGASVSASVSDAPPARARLCGSSPPFAHRVRCVGQSCAVHIATLCPVPAFCKGPAVPELFGTKMQSAPESLQPSGVVVMVVPAPPVHAAVPRGGRGRGPAFLPYISVPSRSGDSRFRRFARSPARDPRYPPSADTVNRAVSHRPVRTASLIAVLIESWPVRVPLFWPDCRAL